MVHAATAFAKTSFRLRALVCTSSIGPGATNMVTGAATATVNRLPVLLLPGDIFARRNVAPVLQQLESPSTQDISVNDCFKPVSRYWDRIQRPEQLLTVAARSHARPDFSCGYRRRHHRFPPGRPGRSLRFPGKIFREESLGDPTQSLRSGSLAARRRMDSCREETINRGWRRRPLLAKLSEALAKFAHATGIPVCETQAGKGSLPYDHPQQLGAVGVTGTPGANIVAREADLIIGIGTRYSDFTSASKTAFQNPAVRFININVAEFDAYKHAALPLTGDARVTIDRTAASSRKFHRRTKLPRPNQRLSRRWENEVDRIYGIHEDPPITQGEVIGVVNDFTKAADIVVCAAGSLPGDLHKLWRTRQPGGYHMEYGFSCMGYEIAGGLGAKMADPAREVYVLVGDGSYLMMAQEIVTSLQEGFKINIVLLDNHGFSSIGGLSRACGNEGMGTNYRYRRGDKYDGDLLPVDFAANAASLGAWTARAKTADELKAALAAAREQIARR